MILQYIDALWQKELPTFKNRADVRRKIWSYNFGASIFMETYGNHTSPCEHENAMKIFSVYTESKIEFGWNLIK